jgi:hypothetical protein
MHSSKVKAIRKLIKMPQQKKPHEQNLIRGNVFAQKPCLPKSMAPDQAKNRPEYIHAILLVVDETMEPFGRMPGLNSQLSPSYALGPALRVYIAYAGKAQNHLGLAFKDLDASF